MSKLIKFLKFAKSHNKLIRIGRTPAGVATVLIALPLLAIAGYRLSRSEAMDTAIVFALKPQGRGGLSANFTYPPTTRLYLWKYGSTGNPTWVAPDLQLTSRPDVSFDGKKVLFSAARHGSDVSRLYETDLGGQSVREVLPCKNDCSTPVYLPDGRIAFSMVVPEEGEVTTSSIFVMDRSRAQEIRRITFNEGVWVVRGILEDGRILAGKLSEEGVAAQSLAVRTDGTELEEYLSLPNSDEPRSEKMVSGGAEDIKDVLARVQGSRGRPLNLPEGYRAADVFFLVPRRLPPKETSVVRTDLDFGWLLCLDVYESTFPISRGSADRVKVWDQKAGILLGEAPIEKDGSFFLKVPADRLLSLELVDSRGASLLRQKAGIWVRPNERRGCIGCHEARYLSPENRSPLALAKGAVEIERTGGGS